jgi:hypothetical protein
VELKNMLRDIDPDGAKERLNKGMEQGWEA